VHVRITSHSLLPRLERIAKLYRIETEVRGKPAEQRRAVRQLQAKPLLAELHGWIEETLSSVAWKSYIVLAIRYAQARWLALLSYVDDGTIEIDNSAAERALRVVALRRKNYLFAGSDNGGKRAAAVYSLLGTPSSIGWIQSFISARSSNASLNTRSILLDELLPWNMPGAKAVSTDS
jgi:hypothetical protein